MQSIDRRAIEGMKIPGLTLMENAGKRVAEEILERYDLAGKLAVIVCGKGNNGGDGFVVARHLHHKGVRIRLFFVGDRELLNGDALTNLGLVENAELTIHSVADSSAFIIPPETSLIVDALFGTGFMGDIKAPYDEIIRKIDAFRAPVVAVDAPSGLDGASGRIADPTVRADLTVTFGLPKLGQVVYPGKSYCGQLVVADIGFPDKAISEERINLNMLMADEAARMLPFRAPEANKGDFGKLFVLAGSKGYTGAAAMTAESGLRAGTGLVILGFPDSFDDVFETKLTEVIKHPLPEVRNRRCLALRGLGEIREMAKWADAFAVGPGIGVNEISGVAHDLVIPREAMGRGDLKFLAAIGAFLGWRAVLFSLFAGSLLGSVIGLITLVVGKRVWSAKLPFGPYLAFGAINWMFFGDVFLRWYGGLLSP